MILNKVGAIILAGAPASAEMDPVGVLNSRAMVEINGRPMLHYVVDALRQADSVNDIVAIGEVRAVGLDRVLAPEGSMVDNINRAIPKVESGEYVLVVCADIPLLTAEAVDDFVQRALSLQADLVYPVIDKAHCQGEFAEVKRTFVKTGDGSFTGGNMTLVRRDFFTKHAQTIARAYQARKKPLLLARLIGYGVLFRFALGQIFPAVLKLKHLERAAGKLLGAELRALVTDYAEIGQDVDKADDIRAIGDILKNRDMAPGIIK